MLSGSCGVTIRRRRRWRDWRRWGTWQLGIVLDLIVFFPLMLFWRSELFVVCSFVFRTTCCSWQECHHQQQNKNRMAKKSNTTTSLSKPIRKSPPTAFFAFFLVGNTKIGDCLDWTFLHDSDACQAHIRPLRKVICDAFRRFFGWMIVPRWRRSDDSHQSSIFVIYSW